MRAAEQFTPNGNLACFVILRNAWLNNLRHERYGLRFIELKRKNKPC